MNQHERSLLLIAGGLAAGAVIGAQSAPPRYRFAGRVVVVTGGSRGLGVVMVRKLLDQGARVAICARDADELERARSELQERSGASDVLDLVCDVRRPEEAARMIDSVVERWGRIDVLINNAGVIRMGPYDDTTPEDFQELLDTHLFGAMHCCRAAVRHMRRQGEGRIVNISSIGGLVSVPHLLAYSASKHALTGFSRGLRAELARDRIRVTTVCPGVIRTGSPVRAQFKGRHRREQTWFTITASLPLSSVSAERAAAQILMACRRGQARLTISAAAKIASVTDSLAPGFVSAFGAALLRVLPRPGGIGSRHLEGWQSATRLAPSALTVLTQRAARRNNEFIPGREWT